MAVAPPCLSPSFGAILPFPRDLSRTLHLSHEPYGYSFLHRVDTRSLLWSTIGYTSHSSSRDVKQIGYSGFPSALLAAATAKRGRCT